MIGFESYTGVYIGPTITCASRWRGWLAATILVVWGLRYVPACLGEYWAHVLTCSRPGCVHRLVQIAVTVTVRKP